MYTQSKVSMPLIRRRQLSVFVLCTGVAAGTQRQDSAL